jgi:hypothetical protein
MLTRNFWMAAAFLAILCATACDFFRSNKQQHHHSAGFNIEGQWKVDSMISTAKRPDSNFTNPGTMELSFLPDSIFRSINGKDTIISKYYADKDNKVVFIKNDSLYETYPLIVSDSTNIRLNQEKDSIQFVLKKLR